MQQNTLKPAKGSRQKNTRLGIGDTFAGRGAKGQKSRVGAQHKYTAGFEGGQTPLIRRMPKLGGFINHRRIEHQPVNLQDLAKAGSVITPDTLKKAGLIRSSKIAVKILGVGTTEGVKEVTAHAFSATAKAALEKSGAKLTVLTIRTKELQGKKSVRKTPLTK